MHLLILLTVYQLSVAYAAPQLLTFKDGKVGVNFGGYHAEAGLGGLLNGNAAHGGLSASAGTPHGQNAAAGLGGSVDGRSSGFGYAGAQAMPSVGASAILGGTAGENGFLGSEAYANGNSLTKTINSKSNGRHFNDFIANGPPQPPVVTVNSRSDFVQKIKPSKKHTLIKSEDSSSSSNSKVENADHTLIGNRTRNIVGALTPTASDTSSNHPATMIHIHRQRMRERRRLQQQKQDTQNELDQRRTNEHRIRTRQRLQQRHNKDIDVYPTSNDVTTSQYSVDNDANAVHSKQLNKSFHKSINTQTFAQLPNPPTGSNNGVYVERNANGPMLYNIFNIPIGILRTIQESLTGIPAQQYSG